MGTILHVQQHDRWRIDYAFATPGIARQATSAVVERAATHPERWSDHAPVTVTFER